MTVISHCKTATEMRAEVVTELTRQLGYAQRDCLRAGTQKDKAWRDGYRAALAGQIDFWKRVYVQDAVYIEPASSDIAEPKEH